MPVDVNVILQKLGENERTNGMMNAFQALPREEQIQVLEWSKTMCMRLAAMMEKQKVVENSGRAEPVDLPAPKMFVDTALRIGVVYAMLHQNK
ncbi:MAG: hypothetical protein LIP77_03045, partial [Planctomycetes bacterium]|nr:hypothetical protein [Planctomycetota bacterium]